MTTHTQTERDVRVDLAAAYRLVDVFGWTDLIFNHISARVPGPEEHFLINPFGMLYEEITASSLIKVSLDGRVIDNPNPAYSFNQTGYVIHSAIHEARPDVACVLHTHTPAGMAVSALPGGFVAVAQSGMRFSNIAYHGLEGLSVDTNERARIAKDLGDADAMILKNHGLLTTGKSVAQAFVLMHRLEKACQTQLLAMAASRELALPPAAIVQKTFAQLLEQPSLTTMAWPALLRMLDRRDPSFRD